MTTVTVVGHFTVLLKVKMNSLKQNPCSQEVACILSSLYWPLTHSAAHLLAVELRLQDTSLECENVTSAG